MGPRKNLNTMGMFLLSGVFFLVIAATSSAQQFPRRPISVMIAIGPGSPQDVVTRLLLRKAEKSLGQPFVVTNNGAGGGSVALGITAREKPDGYHLIRKFGYEPAPLVLAFVLGPMLEQNLRRSLILSDGSFMIFVTRPISALGLGLALLLLVSNMVPYFNKRRGAYGKFEE